MKEYVKLRYDICDPSGERIERGSVGDLLVYDFRRDRYNARFPADSREGVVVNLYRCDFDFVEGV